MHTNCTSRIFVLRFEFLCSEVREVVVVKWVPRGLCGGVGATARRENGVSNFALVLSGISNTKLDRAWLRWKWPVHTKGETHKISLNETNRRRTWSSGWFQKTYWLRGVSPLVLCGCCEESLTAAPAKLLAVASLGMRWWPRSSVVFGEAGGVWSKELCNIYENIFF